MSVLKRLQTQWAQKLTLARWLRTSAQAARLPLGEMRQHVADAQAMRAALDGVLRVGEDRLARPRIGSNVFQSPVGTDWSWRPYALRRPMGAMGVARIADGRHEMHEGFSVFHDCPLGEVSFRQVRNTRGDDLAPFGIRLDVFHFGGTFLSLACDLPDEVLDGLSDSSIISVGLDVTFEHASTVHARLNFQSGPNTDQMQVPVVDGVAAFDLAYAACDPAAQEKIWFDLILDQPAMNQLRLNDLTFHRRPRADV